MKAFVDTPVTVNQLIKRVRAHRAADELVKNIGWRDGRGCSIGCTFHSYSHRYAEQQTNVPEVLWVLNDCFFEGMANGDSQEWPERFLAACKKVQGADLSLVRWKFLHWLLTDAKFPGSDHPPVRDAIQQVAEVIEPATRGERIDKAAAEAARGDARAVAWTAVWTAEVAVMAAAWTVEVAVMAAEVAAWTARAAVLAAETATGAAARAEFYRRMADKLIELIEQIDTAKVETVI